MPNAICDTNPYSITNPHTDSNPLAARWTDANAHPHSAVCRRPASGLTPRELAHRVAHHYNAVNKPEGRSLDRPSFVFVTSDVGLLVQPLDDRRRTQATAAAHKLPSVAAAVRASSCSIVVINAHPSRPADCPRAMAPPLTLTFFMSGFTSRFQARMTDASAS